ncbi:MAG: Hint domain-containing protein [Rhodobacteraceae bacterium]|nr:Hint domain-containing protein [Paracoccaceae bacterium]
MHTCYPGAAVRRQPATGAWMLDPGFDPASMALHLALADDGGIAALHDASGRERARGALSVESSQWLVRADGGTIQVEWVEVGAVSVVLASEPLEPGHSYPPMPEALHAELCLSAAGAGEHAALDAGAMVATDAGTLPVEWLRAGDRVLTRDNGFQALRCVAHVTFAEASAATLPLLMPADAFGAHKPERPLLVTPAQRVLLAAPELHLWFGESEMFARSDALMAAFAVTPLASPAPRLFALICAAQEVILADGLWLETTLATPALLAALDPASAGALVPGCTTAARASLALWELAMFAGSARAEQHRVAA